MSAAETSAYLLMAGGLIWPRWESLVLCGGEGMVSEQAGIGLSTKKQERTILNEKFSRTTVVYPCDFGPNPRDRGIGLCLRHHGMVGV